ncbi:MAG: O-antigen ligase family protein [Bacteroidetes bacterium]|nr:O-antigen ligase family protein [Bacteroidota bacterium]
MYSEIRYYAPSFLIFLVAYRVATSSSSWKQFNRNVVLISALIALNGLLILISITLDIDFHGDETGEIDRAVGLYSNANRAGYVSCLGQASSLYMVMTRVRNRRYIFMGFYVICMVAALSTFSKGAATVTLFILSVFLFNSFSSPEMMRQKVVKRSINFLLLGLVLIAGYALLNINQIIAGFTAEQAQRSEELIQFYHGEINQATTTNRSELWQYALEQISDSPILGFGLGEFHVMDIGVGVHNIYLLLWGEAGILALLAYVIFLITWFKGSFKVREPSVRFYLRNVLLVVFLSGFAAHTLLVNKSYMIVLGVLIGGFAVDKHHIKLDRIKRYMQSKSESTQEE